MGGLNAEEWAFFGGSEPIGFDGAGNLHVLNTQASQVVIVDPEGGLVRTMGRKGEGPGEFNLVAQFWVWRDGRYVVQDMGHGAYQVFGPTGELERFVRMGAAAGPLAMMSGMRLEVRADPAGGALIAQGMPSMMGGVMSSMMEAMADITGEDVGEIPEAGVDERGLERLDLTGDLVSATPILQAWQVPREETQAELDVEDLLNPANLVEMGNNIRYYEPGFFWDLLPDGTIAYSDSTAYVIRIARPGGEVVDELRRPFSPEAVTDRIRRASIENAIREMEGEGSLGVEGGNPELAEIAEAMAPMMERDDGRVSGKRPRSVSSTPKSRSSGACAPPGTARCGFSVAARSRGTTRARSTCSTRPASTWGPSRPRTSICRSLSGPAAWSRTGNSMSWMCRRWW